MNEKMIEPCVRIIQGVIVVGCLVLFTTLGALIVMALQI